MAPERHRHIRQLAQEAQLGNRRAFEELYLKYRIAIRGYISCRIFDADTVKDIEQATWAWTLETINSYDPERMAFYSFVRYRVMSLIREYYRRRRHRDIPASELTARFPDCKTDIEIFDLLAAIDPMQLRMSKEDRMIAATIIAGTIFSMDRPPHQVLAFGFNNLLEYGPMRIVCELFEIRLADLCDRFELEYEEVSPLAQVSLFVEPLKRKMRRKVKDIFPDAASKRIYRKLFDETVGETALKDYCGNVTKKDDQRTAEAKVSDWAYKVFTGVRKIILRKHACAENRSRTS